jgi:hypothetical protein
MTEELLAGSPPPAEGFDPLDPANMTPLVVALCADDAQGITGQCFFLSGGAVNRLRPWEPDVLMLSESGWDADALLGELLRRFPDGLAPADGRELMERASGQPSRVA